MPANAGPRRRSKLLCCAICRPIFSLMLGYTACCTAGGGEPMKSLLRIGILLLLCGPAATVSVAQVQTTPTPLAVTPLISGLNATLCANGCDNAAMSCQNSCLITGPLAVPPAAFGQIAPNLGQIAGNISGNGITSTASCPLNCTSQQLVCKTQCARTP